MKGVTNVLIAGVGGQGTILASNLVSETALLLGHDVKKSEVHGLAQRGGSVITNVRYGDNVYSPLIPDGMGDFLLAFEAVEAARYSPLLSEEGTMLVNTVNIPSVTILARLEEYPKDPLAGIRDNFKECVEISATDEAVKLKNSRVANVIMLGAFAKRSGLELDAFRQAIRNTVKERFVELNLMAFDKGLEF